MDMRRFMDLFEAPLADVSHYGDWSDTTSNHKPITGQDSTNDIGRNAFAKNSFVSKVDRTLATDPKNLDILKKKFEARAEDFYLYFINDPKMLYFLKNVDYGEITLKQAAHEFPKPMTAKIEQVLENYPMSIQVVLAHNEGGEHRHALTPWTIAHRMVHALMSINGKIGRYNWQNEITSTDRDLEYIAKKYYDFHVAEGETAAGVMLMSLCTMASVRNNKILKLYDSGDYYYELKAEMFTQYILTGKITFKPAPTVLQYGDETLKHPRNEYPIKPGTQADVQRMINQAREHYEGIFQTILKEARGKIVVC
jgi:hypothetical protein